MRHGQSFDYDVYLSFHNYYGFFEKGGIANKQPIWSEKNLYYAYIDSNKKELNVTIPVIDNIKNNKTLYLHMQISTKNPFYIKGVNDNDYDYSNEKFDANGIEKPIT